MDLKSLRQLAPHYLVMVLIMVLLTSSLRAVAPDLSFWVFLGVAILVGLLYPFVVHWLDVAPEPWQR